MQQLVYSNGGIVGGGQQGGCAGVLKWEGICWLNETSVCGVEIVNQCQGKNFEVVTFVYMFATYLACSCMV